MPTSKSLPTIWLSGLLLLSWGVELPFIGPRRLGYLSSCPQKWSNASSESSECSISLQVDSLRLIMLSFNLQSLQGPVSSIEVLAAEPRLVAQCCSAKRTWSRLCIWFMFTKHEVYCHYVFPYLSFLPGAMMPVTEDDAKLRLTFWNIYLSLYIILYIITYICIYKTVCIYIYLLYCISWMLPNHFLDKFHMPWSLWSPHHARPPIAGDRPGTLLQSVISRGWGHVDIRQKEAVVRLPSVLRVGWSVFFFWFGYAFIKGFCDVSWRLKGSAGSKRQACCGFSHTQPSGQSLSYFYKNSTKGWRLLAHLPDCKRFSMNLPVCI